MRRRVFLGAMTGAAASIALGPRGKAADGEPASPGEGVLRGYIVSDSHFGWDHEVQPAPEVIGEMMTRILRRFPNLDLFIDSGDAHHSGADDQARAQWTRTIANACGALPFYYLPGNHELEPTTGVDCEWRCNALGSLECRPYYSVDFKGIHIAFLPQMKRSIMVTRETMEWLALDLEVHKNQTTLIVAHNGLQGITTIQGEHGYRALVNSGEMLALLERYPNVLAWMHGHNHTFEVVRHRGRLFVSNGRIGGFVPPPDWGAVGQGHLGGIYFEVDADGLRVRCHSATHDAFFDELGDTHLSATLERGTTLDPTAPARHCIGYGGMRDGQRMPVVYHHAGDDAGREIFLGGCDDASFNDDPSFSLYMLRLEPSLGPHHQLVAGSVQLNPTWGEMWVENKSYEWLDPGIKLLTREPPDDIARLSVPIIHHGNATCLRCAPGRSYRFRLDLDSPRGGQTLAVTYQVHDRDLKRLAEIKAAPQTLQAGRQQREVTLRLPDLADLPLIYNDPQSDNVAHLMVLVELGPMTSEVMVHRCELALDEAEGATTAPTLLVDGRSHGYDGTLAANEFARVEGPVVSNARSVWQARVEGNRRVSWLARSQPQWQVRNAAVAMRGATLLLGPVRNRFLDRAEIIVAPLTRIQAPYVCRLRGVERARVVPHTPETRRLSIMVLEGETDCEIEVATANAPTQVEGAEAWTHRDNTLLLHATAGQRIELAFA